MAFDPLSCVAKLRSTLDPKCRVNQKLSGVIRLALRHSPSESARKYKGCFQGLNFPNFVPTCIPLTPKQLNLWRTFNEMFSASSAGLCWSALGLLLGSRGLTLRQTNNSSTNGTDCVGINSISPRCPSNETPYYRDFFYVGGHYENSDLGNLTYDQIYVEKLTPVGGTSQSRPIIFFHGGGMYSINPVYVFFSPFYFYLFIYLVVCKSI